MARLRPKPNAIPTDLAFGVNACAMALKHSRVKLVLYLEDTENRRVHAVVERARSAGVHSEAVDLARLDELTNSGVHQGILVRLSHRESLHMDAALERTSGSSLALLLDGITDPRTSARSSARVLPLVPVPLCCPNVEEPH